ncbi:MAG TPA: hypothetical protein VGI20_08850 [Rhizomicrobium sp.]
MNGRSAAAAIMLAIATSFALDFGAAAAVSRPVHVALGKAVVALDGPWKFHTGDDPGWAQTGFDDASWESVDLTPAPGAHDSDVGLTGYVGGWQSRGHSGYSGFAWYRIRVSIDAPQDESLAVNAPFYVDSAYQIFANGRLLGSAGDFSGRTPAATNPHLPRLFPLPRSTGVAIERGANSTLIAIRVWMGPWGLASPDTGGIHIAPALGTTPGAESLYRIQWSQMIRGYIVDAAEGVLFVLLAVMVCTLIPLDSSNPAYPWMVAALILIALARANQAVFFWWQFETIQGFEMSTITLFVPLALAAWTLAWCTWLRLPDRAWMFPVVGISTLVYVGSQFLRRSWFHGVFPGWFGSLTISAITLVRLLFVLLTLLIVFRSLRRPGSERWFALPAILLISIGLFAQELSMLHVPGIWFPFGVGVSRTEYAYAAFDVALFVLLLHRLYTMRSGETHGTAFANDV